MKQVYEYNPNYKSVDLLMELFDFFHNYGLEVTGFVLKIYNTMRNKLEYLNVKNVLEYIEDSKDYLRKYAGTTGYNLFLLTFVELKNNNLEKYQNRFVVDLKDLENIIIKKVNIVDKFNQHIVDREIERYLQLINGLLTDYRIKYKLSYQIIEKEQDDEDNNTYNNYVDGNYIKPIDYVTPQIN